VARLYPDLDAKTLAVLFASESVPVQQRASARLRCRRRHQMTKRQDRDSIYVKRQFDTEIIVLCVRWYISYRLSYRDLVAMMAERGVSVSHTTIMRWVIRYVPEFEKRWNRFARSIGSSWRVDETYISIKGKWHYLYRAVDKQGRSVDFVLRQDRGIAAAQAFFRKALAAHADRAPRKITLDGHISSHRALRLLRREHPAWRRVSVRCSKYLNNIIEQDHRAIKRRCASMKGFKSFANAAVTIAGVELAHRIHKHQFSFGRGRPRNDRSLRTHWECAVA
jgi:transposase-like protein